MRPMLAVDAAPGQVDRLVEDPAWVAQLKVDGDRAALRYVGGRWQMLNRAGKPASRPIPPAVAKALGRIPAHIAEQVALDGELIGDVLVVFDLVGPLGFADRFSLLSGVFEVCDLHGTSLVLLPVADGVDAKRALLASAEADNREGVIFRRSAALYQAGRTADLVRHKFVKEAECIVSAVGLDGHDNVELVLLDPDGRYSEGILKVGRASALGKSPTPAPGQVWTVRYLYTKDPAQPRLYQPRLVRLRDDKEMHECVASQIDGSFTNQNVEGIA